MTSQSAMPLLHTTPRRGASARRVARGVLGWLPLAIAMGLFAQFSLGGLRPALAERHHLARMRTEMELRHAADLAIYGELDLRHRARMDPIFRERQRRQLARGASWAGR